MSIQLTIMSLDFDSTAAPFTKVFNKEEITLGRLPGNDLVLDKPEISGYHASLRVGRNEDGQIIFIKDLGSSNGTMVENSPLRAQSEVSVEPNQRIIIGNYLIKPTFVESKDDQTGVEEVEEKSNVTPITEAFTSSLEEELDAFQESEEEEFELQMEERQEANGGTVSFAEMFTDPATETVSAEVFDTIQATNSDAEEFSFTVNVGDSDLDNLNFIAKELCSLAGVVTNKGKALEGVKVRCSQLGETTTDLNGRFSFKRIVEGTNYSLAFEKKGYSFQESQSGKIAKNSPDLEIDACKLVSIKGRIMHGDAPLAEVRLDGGEVLGSTLTDSQGYYCFENVPEGSEYTLRVTKENFVVSKI